MPTKWLLHYSLLVTAYNTLVHYYTEFTALGIDQCLCVYVPDIFSYNARVPVAQLVIRTQIFFL